MEFKFQFDIEEIKYLSLDLKYKILQSFLEITLDELPEINLDNGINQILSARTEENETECGVKVYDLFANQTIRDFTVFLLQTFFLENENES